MEKAIYDQIVVPVMNILTGHVTKHLGYVIYSSKHVTNMKKQLKDLKDATNDVKDKRLKNKMLNNPRIPCWVNEVETFMNEVETFVNEFESMSSKEYGCFHIKMRHRVGKKACEYSETIGNFIKENDNFKKWSNDPKPTGRDDSEPATSIPSSDRLMFTSRAEQFNKALKWLQQDNNKSQVIALCGMGGVGKTTMMELLKTEAKNQKMFDYFVPVDIGNAPDMYSIQNDIAICLVGEDLAQKTKSERADDLCKKFKNLEVEKQRILVTLDNVWPGKIKLSEIGLTSPLPNGLKLLLTSRDSDICRQIAVRAHLVAEVVEVEALKENEAYNLFFDITKVFEEDDRYAIGCKIVEKCGGLPLAIYIIGTTLYSKEKCDWNNALRRLKNNNLLPDVDEVINISYEHIQHEEDKEVFLLCGLFPEDSIIRIEDLTCYAWGLNLFKGAYTLGDARDSTKACVRNLIDAHLLISHDGCVKMHALVHAFVLRVISESDRAWIINHGDVTQLAAKEEMMRESCKRISLTCMGMSEFPQDFKYPNLSLLQLMNGDFSLKFPEDFYENMKNLQVIAYYEMKSPLMISRSPHCSTNLKSLCLYKCKLMFDISFVGDLVNLEVLRFAQCQIRRLPSAIGKLAKLKLLELTESLVVLDHVANAMRRRRRHIDYRVGLHINYRVGLHIDNGVFENLKNLEELYMNVGSHYPIWLTDSNFEELSMIS
ncbi:hypothetical protein E3N88_00179 [Mikania micrantha]|uniref:NB-ARC domain-containing protein n=1 Tax=Mikania micrantha TaxID=192012 RepID=A0A5N6PY71_9ASTR|nr:hypothetical protein E3N88_00179 [Mikania micrantha]